MRDVNGKVAFITGGARGLGFGMAQAFVAAGMRVAIADISSSALNVAKDHLPDVLTVELDVANPDSWERAAQYVETLLGQVHVLCNNAGVSPARAALGRVPLEQISLAEWNWTVAVNLTGPFLGMRTFLPRFKKLQEDTHVLTTSSMAGLFPFPASVPGAYTASKFGVVGLCEQLKLDLFMLGIRHIGVSILFPGLVNTEIFSNSLELSPDAPMTTTAPRAKEDDIQELPAETAYGIAPRLLGNRVLRGILNNECYIFSHGEYKSVAAAHALGVLDCFGESVDPTVKDNIPFPRSYQWGRN